MTASLRKRNLKVPKCPRWICGKVACVYYLLFYHVDLQDEKWDHGKVFVPVFSSERMKKGLKSIP